MWPFRADFLWRELGKHMISVRSHFFPLIFASVPDIPTPSEEKWKGVSKMQSKQRASESTGDIDARGQCFALKSEVSSK